MAYDSDLTQLPHMASQQRSMLPDPSIRYVLLLPATPRIALSQPAVTAAHSCSSHGRIHLMSGSGDVDATSPGTCELDLLQELFSPYLRPQ